MAKAKIDIKKLFTSIKNSDKVLSNDKYQIVSFSYDYDRAIKKYELTTSDKSLLNNICDTLYGFLIETKKTRNKYRVGIWLPVDTELVFDEYDRSTEAKELFKSIYRISEKKVKLNYKYGKNEDDIIEISGDIDNNFKMNKLHYWFDMIDNDSKCDQENKDRVKDKLVFLHEITYHPDNISIMPVSGGMNNIKADLGFDRIDTFLYCLQQYYNGLDSIFLNHGFPRMPYTHPRNDLKKFLDSFGEGEEGLYNYCQKVYHVSDKEFVKRLCESGKKAILNTEDIDDYLNLVIIFMARKAEYYKNSDNEIKTAYQKMIKTLYDIQGKEYINSFTGTDDYRCYCQI